MNKKLICLFLSLIMLLSVLLTGCAKKSDDDVAADKQEDASASAETLTMYLMSEAPVSAETAAAIQDAVNKITENKFKTHLNLKFYTEEEYYAKLDASFAAREEAKQNGTLVLPNKNQGQTEDETIVDADGIIRIKYPTYGSYQVDIFYMGGQDIYNKYKTGGYLASLGGEVDGASKALKQYISPQYLTYMKSVSNGIFAIPTNNPIGEYTYLLLNKEALKDTRYSAKDGFTSLTSATSQGFLKFIHDFYKDQYVPLYTNLPADELLISNLQGWGVNDEGKLDDVFSVLGGYYKEESNYLGTNAYIALENLFENEQFVEDLKVLKGYELGGYYGTEADAEKDFAVGFVKGGAELAEIYADKYEMIVLEAPRLTAKDLYSDLFGVCSTTVSVSRSMEIITFINTNEDIRNLLLYGIEGEHYQVVDTGVENARGETYKVARRLNEEYMMDVSKTGNVLLAYPLEDDNILPHINDYIVQQNRDAKVDLAIGFSLNYGTYNVDVAKLQEIQTLSDGLLAEYLACEDMTALDAFLAKAKQDVNNSEAVRFHLNKEGHGVNEETNEPLACDERCGKLSCAYDAWLISVKLKAKPAS